MLYYIYPTRTTYLETINSEIEYLIFLLKVPSLKEYAMASTSFER